MNLNPPVKASDKTSKSAKTPSAAKVRTPGGSKRDLPIASSPFSMPGGGKKDSKPVASSSKTTGTSGAASASKSSSLKK